MCIRDSIESFPDGYDTVIGEGGATLSGGEKQRISIARAMLKDAPIIIFDEATANVDPENEDQLQKAMEALMKDCLLYTSRPDATREEVMEAAKKARCYDFIMALPKGFDTVIGEGGESLSGGERQRISCLLYTSRCV